MAFPDAWFAVLWAEGVIRLLGFKKSLTAWRRWLYPAEFLVEHDAVRCVAPGLKKIPAWGYVRFDSFLHAEDAWWAEYYRPLETRIVKVSAKYRRNAAALMLLEPIQREIDIAKRSPSVYRSAFDLLQKSENLNAS